MINVSGTSQTWYYYYADALGSIRLLSDAGGAIVESYAYLAFGQPTVMTHAGTDGNWLTEDGTTINTSAYGNPYLFTARRWDFYTQLYYCRFRDYSPLIGRFLQPDPLGYIDGMNLYQYCGNNPLNWLDPWGLAHQAKPDVSFVPPSERAAFVKWYETEYKSVNLMGPANNSSGAGMRAAYQEWVDVGKPKVGKPKGGKWGGGAFGLLLMLDAMRGTAAAPGMDGYVSPPPPTFGEFVDGLVGAIVDPFGLNELIHGDEIQPNPTPKDCPQRECSFNCVNGVNDS